MGPVPKMFCVDHTSAENALTQFQGVGEHCYGWEEQIKKEAEV